MSKYQIETDIDGFIERYLERTANFDDFVPADIIWQAMLHSAGLQAGRRHVWGMSRNIALRYVRSRLYLTPQRVRYYHYPKPIGGIAPGGTFGCYEQLKLSEYALKAMEAPLTVRPKMRKPQMASV